MFLRPLAVLATLFLVSCGSVRLPAPVVSPYRIEIQQGNFVSEEMVSQLKPGMSKDQVRFVLGTPLITDSFHADRWDYVFRRQKSNSTELEHRKLAVFFEDGKLARAEGEVALPLPGKAAVMPSETKAPAPKPEPAASQPPAPKPEVAAPKAPVSPPVAAAATPPAPVPASTQPAPVATPPAPMPAPKPEVVATKPEAPAPKPKATTLGAEAQRQQIPGAVPESKPAGQAAAGGPAAKPAQPPSADKPAEEKRGWWDRIKDKVKF